MLASASRGKTAGKCEILRKILLSIVIFFESKGKVWIGSNVGTSQKYMLKFCKNVTDLVYLFTCQKHLSK